MKKLFVCILLFFIILGNVSQAQDDNFKALFIYNVTNFIEWPAVEGNFVIYVLGNSPIIDIFKSDSKLKDKKVAGTPIAIEPLNDVKNAGSCQILYVPEDQADKMDAAVAAIGSKAILIVTHFDGAITKGSCINFYNKPDGKLTMQISRKNIESHGLKVGSQLLYLGDEVN